MPTKNKAVNNTGINNYLAIKRMRSEATFCYRPNGSYWLVNNHMLTDRQFNEMFPLELTRPNVKGETIGHKQAKC